MINKTKKIAFVLAAALVAGTASMAQAYEKLDPATGLRTEFYYAPLATLAQQGAPISAQGRAYLRQHQATGSRARGSEYYASTRRGGLNARAEVLGPRFEPGAGNWQSPQNCMPEFSGAGAPQGPYCSSDPTA